MSTADADREPTPEEAAEIAAITAGDADASLNDLADSADDSPLVAEAKRRRRTLLLLRKIGITILGGLVLTAGLIMLFIPGPGGLAIVLGLFILSLEYEWAERRLDQVRDKVLDAARAAASNPVGTTLSVLGALAMIVGGFIWARNDDLPFSSWATGGATIVGGVLALGTIVWSVRDLRQHRARTAAADSQ